jgi:glutamate-1-semialdehyde 2,1-aminomutase
MNRIHTQADWISRARKVLPAGGFGNFDPGIVIIARRGARVWDEDGREYVDYLIGSGPMLLGHGHPEVMEAVLEQLAEGHDLLRQQRARDRTGRGDRATPCPVPNRCASSPPAARPTCMRSGWPAPYRAREDPEVRRRLSRHVGRGADEPRARAREVNFPHAVPDSAGIPQGVRRRDADRAVQRSDFVRSLLAEHGDVAAIIVEPLQRIIPPSPAFCRPARLCDRHGIVLIFDEIVTGFRFAYGGAQEHYGVTPDICTLGKIIGGGFPLGRHRRHRPRSWRISTRRRRGPDKLADAAWHAVGQSGAPAVAGLKTMEVLRRPGSGPGGARPPALRDTVIRADRSERQHYAALPE